MLGRSPKGPGTASSDGAVPSRTMSYSLSHHVHAALRGEDLVVLDAAAGRYACVPAVGDSLRLADGSRALEILDDDLAAALMDAGFVRLFEGPSLAEDLPGPVEREARRHPHGARPDVRLIAEAVKVGASQFHGRTFSQLTTAAAGRNGRAGARGVDLALAADLAAAFYQALPWIPFQGDCLYRSFVLQALLAQRDLSATWVFGVQTWPFEAHCWLQVEDMVLDDTCDHVRGFTPILAV